MYKVSETIHPLDNYLPTHKTTLVLVPESTLWVYFFTRTLKSAHRVQRYEFNKNPLFFSIVLALLLTCFIFKFMFSQISNFNQISCNIRELINAKSNYKSNKKPPVNSFRPKAMTPPCQFYNTGFIYSKPKLYNYHALKFLSSLSTGNLIRILR